MYSENAITLLKPCVNPWRWPLIWPWFSDFHIRRSALTKPYFQWPFSCPLTYIWRLLNLWDVKWWDIVDINSIIDTDQLSNRDQEGKSGKTPPQSRCQQLLNNGFSRLFLIVCEYYCIEMLNYQNGHRHFINFEKHDLGAKIRAWWNLVGAIFLEKCIEGKKST